MLKASNITKTYAGRAVLDGVSFVVNPGECLGVVAPNGAGKTTLLRILAGQLAPEAGSVEMAPGAVAYVRQGFAHDAVRPAAVVFPSIFRVLGASARLEAAANALAAVLDARALDRAQRDYDAALEAAGADADGLAGAWRELGLRDIAPDELAGALSGGEQTKLALLDAFSSSPDALLLDEPTNNLDLRAATWLTDRLDAFAGPIVLVSHDRALLDEHADMILELDHRTGKAQLFPGGYTDYAEEKARRRDAQWAQYRRQQDRERRVKQEIRDIKGTALRREKSSQNDFYRRKAKKVARRAVVLERRLERELQSEERVDKPVMREYAMKTEIRPVSRGGDRMLAVDDVTLTIAGRSLLSHASFQLAWGQRAVIIGPNGGGKTTLLRAIVSEEPPHSGAIHLGPSVKLGYLPQDTALETPGDVAQPSPAVLLDPQQRPLEGSPHVAQPSPAVLPGRSHSNSHHLTSNNAPDSTPLSLIRNTAPLSETEARRFLHRFLFQGDAVHTPIASLSYGERRRLSLATLVLGGANLLILDEPTNHLDIPSREALEAALDSYDGAILAVTHDRYFIDRFARRLLLLEDGTLREL